MNEKRHLDIYKKRIEKFKVAKEILICLNEKNFLKDNEISFYEKFLDDLKKVNLNFIANNLDENILIGDKKLIYSQLKEDLENFIKNQISN